MSEVISLGERRGSIICGAFFMHIRTDDGNVHKVELTGEETISTGCPVCGREHTMPFDDFIEIIKDTGLYGTSVFCSGCSKKRMAQKETRGKCEQAARRIFT